MNFAVVVQYGASVEVLAAVLWAIAKVAGLAVALIAVVWLAAGEESRLRHRRAWAGKTLTPRRVVQRGMASPLSRLSRTRSPSA